MFSLHEQIEMHLPDQRTSSSVKHVPLLNSESEFSRKNGRVSFSCEINLFQNAHWKVSKRHEFVLSTRGGISPHTPKRTDKLPPYMVMGSPTRSPA
jgi:hypothetical protein